VRVFSPPMTLISQIGKRLNGLGAAWRGLAVFAGVAALCAAAIFGPLLIASPEYTLAFFRNLSVRGAWQSAWAVLDGYYGVGVVAPLELRYDPGTVGWLPPGYLSSRLPWAWITLGFAALGLFLYTRKIEWANPIRSTAFTGLTMGLLLLYSKGYSPAFSVHLAVLALLLLPDLRGVIYGTVFGIIAVFDWPLLVQMFPRWGAGLPVIVLARTVLTIVLGLDFSALALPESRPLQVIRRYALPAYLVVAAAVAVSQIGPMGRAYAALRLEYEPLAPVIEAIRADESQPPVVVVQPSLLLRVQPYLPQGEVRYVPSGNDHNGVGFAWVTPDEWLPGELAGHDRAWLIFDNREESRRALASEFRGWLDAHGCPISQTWVDTDWVGHYAIAPTPAPQPIEAEFEGGVRLVSATVPDAALHPGEALCVRLVWEADEPPPADYAAFVHVLSAEGVLVAQSDLWPDAPTSTWGPGQAITTGHGLWLPADLPPGAYALRAGLYTPGDGVRLPLVGGGDSANLGAMPIGNP